MTINFAEFVKSCPNIAACPQSDCMEYAFIGRSNVGKSSLINMLTNKKNLALTSAKPGKTLLINYFMINKQWYLVDLPGYGYATIGKDARKKLQAMIDGYVLNRQQLTNLFVLIDCRHPAQKIDLEFINFLGENGVPFCIVFTKADKLSKSQLAENVSNYKAVLSETWEELPPIFITSSENKSGKEEILDYIEQISRNINENNAKL